MYNVVMVIKIMWYSLCLKILLNVFLSCFSVPFHHHSLPYVLFLDIICCRIDRASGGPRGWEFLGIRPRSMKKAMTGSWIWRHHKEGVSYKVTHGGNRSLGRWRALVDTETGTLGGNPKQLKHIQKLGSRWLARGWLYLACNLFLLWT